MDIEKELTLVAEKLADQLPDVPYDGTIGGLREALAQFPPGPSIYKVTIGHDTVYANELPW